LQETPQGISLDLSFDEVEPDVKLVGNPFIDAALSDLTNLVKCTFPTAVGLLVDAFQGEFPINQKVKIPGGKPLRLGAVAVLDGLSLTPRLTGTAVGLVEKTPETAIVAASETPFPNAGQGGRP
jgi:hypothetical protein